MAVELKRGSAVSALSITPLIDVVFLLLIFFLVTTRFEEEDRELEVELPDATQSLPLTYEPKQMFINIDQEGRYFVDGQQRELGEVEQLMSEAVTNNPLTQSVIMRVDKRVAFDSFVAVLDLCKKVGVSFSIETKQH